MRTVQRKLSLSPWRSNASGLERFSHPEPAVPILLPWCAISPRSKSWSSNIFWSDCEQIREETNSLLHCCVRRLECEYDEASTAQVWIAVIPACLGLIHSRAWYNKEVTAPHLQVLKWAQETPWSCNQSTVFCERDSMRKTHCTQVNPMRETFCGTIAVVEIAKYNPKSNRVVFRTQLQISASLCRTAL